MKQLTLGRLIGKLRDFNPDLMIQHYRAVSYRSEPDEVCLIPRGKQVKVQELITYLQDNVLYSTLQGPKDEYPCRYMSDNTPVWVDTHEINFNNFALVDVVYDETEADNEVVMLLRLLNKK